MKFAIVIYGEDMVRQLIGPFEGSDDEANAIALEYIETHDIKATLGWTDVIKLENPEFFPKLNKD